MTHSPTPCTTLEAVYDEVVGLDPGRSVLFLGGTDTGKSTAVRNIANRILESGRSVVVIDLDVGQGELGPPGTISAALGQANTSIRSVRELPVISTRFVGAVTPVRHLLEICLGAVKLVEDARAHDPGIVLIDTCGLISGSSGRVLKRRLIEALVPDIVVAIDSQGELDAILSTQDGLKRPRILRASPAAETGRKTPAVRGTRRAARFLAAFDEAKSVALSFDDVAIVGATFSGGQPMSLSVSNMTANTLRADVMYAVDLPDGSSFVIMRQTSWYTEALAELGSTLRRRPIHVTSAVNYAHLLVGLVDRDGIYRGVGIIERIDFERRLLTVLTRCSQGLIAQVQLGYLRVRADGREIAEVRPGDI